MAFLRIAAPFSETHRGRGAVQGDSHFEGHRSTGPVGIYGKEMGASPRESSTCLIEGIRNEETLELTFSSPHYCIECTNIQNALDSNKI
ncbi:hypothetical protein Y1Q_0012590 [Alligator mississippiensis]|uniref:Uncharacterized protein n=1 Tax=Alligator mississippiensis TaxID=8496 RepID=A0A151M8E1_ALLMI|nr:hypothetical protein Y1Q_0012590 [Alligator mississippiensis]